MAIPEKSESDMDIPDSPSVAIHQNSSILPWDASFWGSDPQEKLKLVINLAYASIGLSFLSLFLHFIWFQAEMYDYYEDSFLCYIIDLSGIFFLEDMVCWVNVVPGIHYISVLSFPVILGLLVVYFYKEDSPDPSMKTVVGGALILLIVLRLIRPFLDFIDFFVYEGGFFSAATFLYLSELAFLLFISGFAVSMIIGVKSDTSKFIGPTILSVVFLYLILLFYESLWIGDEGNFWSSEMSLSFKLYALLQFITLPLFFYSMVCLYAYRDIINPWDGESAEDVPQYPPPQYPPPQYPPQPSGGISVAAASKLKEAKELLDQGIINEEEFQKIKDEYFPY